MQITESQLQKIARLTMQGVRDDDICEIMQLTNVQLSEIKRHEVYLKIRAETMDDRLDTFETINDGLDAIEMMSVNQLLTYLKASVDPDFALKALSVVNRATRKGHVSNKPLEVPSGNRTTIDLSTAFVLAIQNGRDEARPMLEQLEQKVVNSLSIDKVEKVLATNEPELETLLAISSAGE